MMPSMATGFAPIMDLKPYLATFSGEINVLPFVKALSFASLVLDVIEKRINIPLKNPQTFGQIITLPSFFKMIKKEYTLNCILAFYC